ncbi:MULTISPECIES: LysR family transcriptional regulator [unclassified Acidovorax]|uniref:LysR family transcriptional regulator n=1 Tax=unclassified Acidovorax TaxID=2684926 RepID=UPI001C450029|nr:MULTISPECIES: LysR family transcriptional regulator [unclassified Acidovorax]MBV7429369.1 LysR family transcriptional regulator [Acidovorax sp. sif0732]MBV7451195.1 LysR family transcriptional regulator [Acidovorax sp. sif0715]
MLHITLRQLEAFYWAATLGTVAAAAKHLFVSQPAITARVKELEEVLELGLLTRSQQGVELTPAGRDLLQHAQRMLQLGAEMEMAGTQDIPPLDGVLRMGADESSATAGMSELLQALRARYPSLRVDLTIDRSKVLNEKLNRRELDIALQTTPALRPHVIDSFLGEVQVAWIASIEMERPDTPFTPRDAENVPLIITPQPSILHHVARNWLAQSGTDLHRLNTCNSLAMIMKTVLEGHAMAAMPIPLVAEPLRQGRLKLVDAVPPLPSISYYVSFLAERRPAGVETIVEMARSVLKEVSFFTPPEEPDAPSPSA